MRVRMNRQAGFSLVDLVITMAIFGLLVCLVLPVIQGSQQYARVTACQAKLRDLGMAVLRFEASRGALPPAGLIGKQTINCYDVSYGTNFPCFPINRQLAPTNYPLVSWIVLCLPELGYQQLYDQFDFHASPYAQPQSAYGAQVPALECPANAGATSLVNDGAGSLNPFAQSGFLFSKGSYAAYASPMHIDHQRWFPGGLGGFVPGDSVGQTLASVTDGASRTILASEVRALDYVPDHRGVWSLPFPGSTMLGLDWHHRLQPGENANKLQFVVRYVPDPDYEPGQLPNTQDALIGDSLFFCQPTIMRVKFMAPCLNISTFMSVAPRSNHAGGVNMVLLDGRTTFVGNDIDGVTLAYLVSANDGNNQASLTPAR